MQNNLLYNASMSLVQAAKYVRPIDKEFAMELLDKAEEYKNQIVIDEDLEKEILEFEGKIGKGLSD